MQRLFASQISLHKLELFCLVCETQSVTHAADRVGLAQPAVTAHMRFLEDKLGVRLFERSGRRLSLTQQGKRVHAWASEVITRTRELDRELDLSPEDEGGRAVVAGSMSIASYILPPLFAEFRRAHALGGITVMVSTPHLTLTAVRDGSCDFGVSILDTREDTDGLHVERLWTEQLVLIAAPDSDLVGESADAGQLARLPFVCSPRNQLRRQLEEAGLRAHGVLGRRVTLEFGHPEAIKRAVRSGAGVAFDTEAAVREEIARGLLRRVATPGLEISLPAFLVYRREKHFSEFQARLLDFVRQTASNDASS